MAQNPVLYIHHMSLCVRFWTELAAGILRNDPVTVCIFRVDRGFSVFSLPVSNDLKGPSLRSSFTKYVNVTFIGPSFLKSRTILEFCPQLEASCISNWRIRWAKTLGASRLWTLNEWSQMYPTIAVRQANDIWPDFSSTVCFKICCFRNIWRIHMPDCTVIELGRWKFWHFISGNTCASFSRRIWTSFEFFNFFLMKILQQVSFAEAVYSLRWFEELQFIFYLSIHGDKNYHTSITVQQKRNCTRYSLLTLGKHRSCVNYHIPSWSWNVFRIDR